MSCIDSGLQLVNIYSLLMCIYPVTLVDDCRLYLTLVLTLSLTSSPVRSLSLTIRERVSSLLHLRVTVAHCYMRNAKCISNLPHIELCLSVCTDTLRRQLTRSQSRYKKDSTDATFLCHRRRLVYMKRPAGRMVMITLKRNTHYALLILCLGRMVKHILYF